MPERGVEISKTGKLRFEFFCFGETDEKARQLLSELEGVRVFPARNEVTQVIVRGEGQNERRHGFEVKGICTRSALDSIVRLLYENGLAAFDQGTQVLHREEKPLDLSELTQWD